MVIETTQQELANDLQVLFIMLCFEDLLWDILHDDVDYLQSAGVVFWIIKCCEINLEELIINHWSLKVFRGKICTSEFIPVQ